MDKQHVLLRFVDSNLRGAGQVMFMNNPITGEFIRNLTMIIIRTRVIHFGGVVCRICVGRNLWSIGAGGIYRNCTTTQTE